MYCVKNNEHFMLIQLTDDRKYFFIHIKMLSEKKNLLLM